MRMLEDNLPRIRLGVVAVSRDNFSQELSANSLYSVVQACKRRGIDVVTCGTIVENDADVPVAIQEMRHAGCNALAVVLGNFGPEGPAAMLAGAFGEPVMYAAVSEDSTATLYDSRRDAYCGLLNCSYNLKLRGSAAYIPENPVSTAESIAEMIEGFLPVATAKLGLMGLKMITFGPRPKDFYACNAPLIGLYELGIEVEENSELDLFLSFQEHEGDSRIPEVAAKMRLELASQKYEELLPRLAQYELTLLDWVEKYRGSRCYTAIASKCWPAFQRAFGFLPCYVHGRLLQQGYPVGCEADIYGALSQYIGLCLSKKPTLLLDINNDIPSDLYAEVPATHKHYRQDEMFIAFHCGNAPKSMMAKSELKYKLNRKDPYAAETGKENCRGTLEGRIREGPATCFRLHAAADGSLQAYVAQGEILPLQTNTYGCYAVLGVPNMARFYRYVLLARQFPHHTALMYGNYAAELFDLFQLLGLPELHYNRPAGERYPEENPFRPKKY